MATPTTRGGLPQPGKTPSQATAASPPASTPFSTSQGHTLFSPIGRRSSPQQLKKSPVTSTTLLGHQHNGSLNVDSPLAAAAMGTLGLGGSIALSLDRVDAAGAPGISTNPGGEEERAARLESIIDTLSVSKGRVSDVGLERLAQRLGLSTYFEESTYQGRKCKTLLIGGSALEITILMDRSVVYNVTVGYPMSSPVVTRHAESTSKILLEDLTLGVHRSPLTKKLEKFAANLEYLANLDKLSVMPGLDCHEALAGIFESLERLHKWDSGKLRQGGVLKAQIQNFIAGGNPDYKRSSTDHPVEQDADALLEEYLKMELICSRHGIPSMNAGSKVGLSIQYWTDFRRSLNKNITIGFPKHMRNRPAKLWSLRIGCAALNNALFPAIRSSEKWLSIAVQKPNPLPEEILSNPTGVVLDWDEPEPTTLPSTDESKDQAAEIPEPRIPMVMFVARLDPPITLPQAVWTQLFQATGSLVPVPNSYPTFDSIHFAIPAGVNHVASETRTIRCRRVLGIAEGTEDETVDAETVHDSTLFIYKPVYGQTLDVLPFSHPRQLVAILPVLRQYAFLTTILKQSFCQDELSRHILDTAKSPAVFRTTNTKDELRILSSVEHGSSTSQRRKSLRLDVTLTVHPVPRFHMVFPFRSATADIVVEIRFNGSVYIVSQNVVPEPKVGMETEPRGSTLCEVSAKSIDKEGLESLLEAFQDLCLWTQWILQHLE